jgi:hypothetical protein
MALTKTELEFCELQAAGVDASEAAKRLGLKNVLMLTGRADIAAQVRALRHAKESDEIDDANVAAGREALKELGIVPDVPDGKLLGLDDVQQLMQKALAATSGNNALARENGNLLVAISRIAEKREDRQRGVVDIDKVTEGDLKRLSEPELREFVQGVVARMKKS